MQISVTLRVSGDLLSPEEITSMLKVIPHVARRKGETRTSSSGKEIVSKFGFWYWKSEDIGEVLTINDHINRIQITFEHAYALLNKLPNAENAWIDVCIVKNDEEEAAANVGFLLDPHSISILRDIGLPIEFTIY